jgi:multiple sugar transport system ATP-binding protein
MEGEPKMAKVVMDDIQKIYPDGTQAIFDLSLEVEDGEFVILVGPSGCGKSTALRMVAGLEEISGGKMYIGEKVVNDLSPKERDIAMVFQSYALYPHMTVADNMGFALKLAKVDKSEIERRVKDAADILGLNEYLHRKPKALSGGQRQRVAMGRAIVRSPQAFLMDEPLSNLDAKLRVQMRAEIAALQNRLGVTTLYVTHDQVEAMTMGDRVAVLRAWTAAAGRLPQTLYDRPDNLFVAGFIGSPSMNIAAGKILKEEGKISSSSTGARRSSRSRRRRSTATRRPPTSTAPRSRSGSGRSTTGRRTRSPRARSGRTVRSSWSRCSARRCSCTSTPTRPRS